MQAGKLDQRVTLERQTDETDAYGQPLDQWSQLATVWAAVEPLVGREFIAAMSLQSEVTARLRLRYRPDVKASDRVVHGATVYNIQSIIQVRSNRRELQLMCKAVA